MAIPNFTMRQLLEAGVHFGHLVHRWNPRMGPYIYGERDGIHIIDLQQTVPMLYAALTFLRDTARNGGRILFVGTKRQAQRPVEEHARRCGQHFVNQRWLGGALTNWKTISRSIDRLDALDVQLEKEDTGLTKKELLNLQRQRAKLLASLGGIRVMGGLPDAIVVIDTNHERIAVTEAKSLGIPVIAILDSNSDPEGIAYPVPGNDDATRALILYCSLFAASVLDGMQAAEAAAGVDVGAAEEAADAASAGDGKAAEDGAGEKPEEPAAEPKAGPAAEDGSGEKPEEPAAGSGSAGEPAADDAGEPAAADGEKEKESP